MANWPAGLRDPLTPALAALALLAFAPVQASASCGNHVVLKGERPAECVPGAPCHLPPAPCEGPSCQRQERRAPAAPAPQGPHRTHDAVPPQADAPEGPPGSRAVASQDLPPARHPAEPPEPPPR